MRVKCLAQEHNTMTRPGLEPALTTRPPRLFHVEVCIGSTVVTISVKFYTDLLFRSLSQKILAGLIKLVTELVFLPLFSFDIQDT